MTKDPNKLMSHWIAAVKQVAYQLTDIGTTTSDKDIIIALKLGLPNSYKNFVVTLDSTPFDQLTLDYVTMRLLNEESRQAPHAPQAEHALAATVKHRCYHCGKHGHFAADCSKQAQDSASNVDLPQGKCMKCEHARLAFTAEDETSFAF